MHKNVHSWLRCFPMLKEMFPCCWFQERKKNLLTVLSISMRNVISKAKRVWNTLCIGLCNVMFSTVTKGLNALVHYSNYYLVLVPWGLETTVKTDRNWGTKLSLYWPEIQNTWELSLIAEIWRPEEFLLRMTMRRRSTNSNLHDRVVSRAPWSAFRNIFALTGSQKTSFFCLFFTSLGRNSATVKIIPSLISTELNF